MSREGRTDGARTRLKPEKEAEEEEETLFVPLIIMCSETPRWKQLGFVALLMGILMFLYNAGSGLSLNTRLGPDPAPSGDRTEEQDDSEFYVPYPRPYRLLIDEPERCQQGAPFLVIVVPVSPGDRTSRDAIRDTWGGLRSASGHEVQLYFLLGSVAEGNETQLDRSAQDQLLEESRLHHDVLQGDFVDSYRNLTLKTMLMLEWLSSHCPDAAYAMKVDADIFLNAPNLLQVLGAAPRRSYVGGPVQRRAEVQRDTRSKWYLPHSAYPGTHYPPYALGLGYVFSMDLPGRILQVSARVRALYIEDVYVGLCLRELGVAPRHEHMFRAGLPRFLMPRCYWTHVITTIMSDSEQLLQSWETYQKQLGYC